MDIIKALEVKKSIFILRDFLEIQPIQLVRSICLLDDNRKAKLVEASKTWNDFEEMNKKS